MVRREEIEAAELTQSGGGDLSGCTELFEKRKTFAGVGQWQAGFSTLRRDTFLNLLKCASAKKATKPTPVDVVADADGFRMVVDGLNEEKGCNWVPEQLRLAAGTLAVYRLRLADITEAEHTLLLQLCLLYTSPSPRDGLLSRMPSSA